MSKLPEAGQDAPAFVAEANGVYDFVGAFFEALVAAGVEHVVVSPGSRSTPLTIAADRCAGLRCWVELDERCAGFFALGLARATRRPVAVVCTSGTAAANYLPAVIEAHYSRLPLLVLTADRPPELRDWGAGQTIEQTGLYGRYPRWSVEVPVPAGGSDALRYATRLGARAAESASGRPAGPVHLNWPLREPLAPPTNADALSLTADPGLRFSRADPVALPEQVDELVALATHHERGVLVCGPMDPDARLRSALMRFSRAAGWPLFADPASQLRAGPGTSGSRTGSTDDLDGRVIAGDAIARIPAFVQETRPEVVLRFGESPVSKSQRLWLEAAQPQAVWWFDEGASWGEPSARATRVIRDGAHSLLESAAIRLEQSLPSRPGSSWSQGLRVADARARRALEAVLAADTPLSGVAVAGCLSSVLPSDAMLFSSNSMAIRLLDLALDRRADPLELFCNRGASGIDGVTSCALGVAAARPGRANLLLTGDLAFLHDLGGLLLAHREAIDLVIVVMDDDGGGIFSFLPVAAQGEAVHFDRLFRTPHGLDLEGAAQLFGLAYARVGTRQDFTESVGEAFARGGVTLIHVPLDAEQNEAAFRNALASVAADYLPGDSGSPASNASADVKEKSQ